MSARFPATLVDEVAAAMRDEFNRAGPACPAWPDAAETIRAKWRSLAVVALTKAAEIAGGVTS